MKSFRTRKPITFCALWGLAIALILAIVSSVVFSSPARADGMGPTETATITPTLAITTSANTTQGEGYPPPAEGIQVQELPTADISIQITQPAPPVIEVDDGGSFLLGPFILLLLALVAFGAIAFLLMRKR